MSSALLRKVLIPFSIRVHDAADQGDLFVDHSHPFRKDVHIDPVHPAADLDGLHKIRVHAFRPDEAVAPHLGFVLVGRVYFVSSG